MSPVCNMYTKYFDFVTE